jgi:ABC-type antimicrobial peptide transport system permease subunit
VATAAIVFTVVIVSAWLPALRAATVDPITAVRAE